MHLQDAAAGAGDILSEAKTGVPAGGAGWRGWERRFRQLGLYTAYALSDTFRTETPTGTPELPVVVW